jgi:DnaJ-class molecular chaperone
MAKPVKVDCNQCGGKGKKLYPGKNKKQDCNFCGGTGKVTIWK